MTTPQPRPKKLRFYFDKAGTPRMKYIESLIEDVPEPGIHITRPVAGMFSSRRASVVFGYVYAPNVLRDEDCEACKAGRCVKRVEKHIDSNGNQTAPISVRHNAAGELE